MTATVDAAVRTLVSPGFGPEDRVESPVVKYKRDTGKWCCLLCQRQFATETLLAHHLNGGAHHREGASGGSGSGMKAGSPGSQLVSPSAGQRLREGRRQLGGLPHLSPEAGRHRARAEVTHEGNRPAELQPLEPLEPLEALEVLEAMTPRTVRACR